jgi:predicted peptidase
MNRILVSLAAISIGLVFLHGSGERGSDIEKVKVNGPPKLVGADPAFPFVVLSPQLPEGEEWWSPTELDATLDAALQGLRVDRDRIYLTGLSLGGIATWAWAAARPDRFAAIAPVAAFADTASACKLKAIPTWVFHGDSDPVVPVAGDFAMVQAVRACGGTPRLTIYPATGHDSWSAAYSDPALYLWFLRQRRAGP